ncbi:hypothetical protein [Lacrimispora sphenoides]|jgi:hypothetical protein|uniref:hypothetical protein n=1 Tax=Lacrimispora sphenoides TaxID=29370 RepID=UPI000B858CBB|nr:hypothetical protein [Lacrimispora sphenoides]
MQSYNIESTHIPPLPYSQISGIYKAMENISRPTKKDCSHLLMRTALKAYIKIEAFLKPCKR